MTEFGVRFLSNLAYEPNERQLELVAALSEFVLGTHADSIFVLNGHAGTGKTSLTGALVRTLSDVHRPAVLLAPTGRAAKVFAAYAGHSAFTIHRHIYRQSSYAPDYGGFQLAENKHADTLFIVDEASMMPNSNDGAPAAFGSGRLLDDLIEYVFTGSGNRLILLGDSAQLPPVGLDESPALSPEQMRSYGMPVFTYSLTETARQATDSGILYNANLLRRGLAIEPLPKPELVLDRFDDFRPLQGDIMQEIIDDSYSRDGIQESIIITRSNRRATMFNTGIRNRVLYREEELSSGDRLLIVKNNYHWAAEYKEVDFIANGDIATVSRVSHTEERYGFRFADVTLYFADLDVELDAKICLDALYSDAPALTGEQQRKLFEAVAADTGATNKRELMRAIKADPYFNALQVKFAYAVTCHKAQGGQWYNVFIDMGFIPEEALTTRDFYRWLYTAITRASQQVYLLGNF